jgi:CDP-paratose 2-epimerase
MHDTVLITGGAGFVGSTLAIAIRRAHPGTTVIAFDNLRRRGSEMNLPRLKAEGVRFVHGDVRSLADLAAIRPAPDLILECSAEPSVLAGYGGSPEYLIHTNLTGCFHCLEIARQSKADFLLVSTSRVYPVAPINGLCFEETETRFRLRPGQSVAGASEFGISEEFPLHSARSLYGMTKLAAELMVAEYGDAYGIRFVIDRCGLLTGPWQMAKADQGVVAFWVAAHCLNRGRKYFRFGGTGKQVRDFLHIDDFAILCWTRSPTSMLMQAGTGTSAVASRTAFPSAKRLFCAGKSPVAQWKCLPQTKTVPRTFVCTSATTAPSLRSAAGIPSATPAAPSVTSPRGSTAIAPSSTK